MRSEKVDEIADSMSLVGLLHPILVYKANGTAQLIAGAHRLHAARQLGWEWIDSIVVDGDEVNRKLCEIAENLHRSELTAIERDEAVAEWIKLMEYSVQSAPKPKGGRPESGISAAARKLGIDETDAKRAVKVASLTEAAKEAARETGLDDNRSALLEAAKAPAAQQVLRTRAGRRNGRRRPVSDRTRKKHEAEKAANEENRRLRDERVQGGLQRFLTEFGAERLQRFFADYEHDVVWDICNRLCDVVGETTS